MTCVMRPVWLAGVAMKLSPSNSYLDDRQSDRACRRYIASAPEMISISSLVIMA